ERAILNDRLLALKSGQESTIVVLEGEAGMGKSCLVDELYRRARAENVTTLLGVAEAVERYTPYYAWGAVFSQLFHLDIALDRLHAGWRPSAGSLSAAQQERVLAWLESLTPELVHLAPLLKAVLPLNLPDNDVTIQMVDEVRRDNTHKLLVAILNAVTRAVPLLVILEDVYWLESASWAMAHQVSREVRPLLFVVVTRPLPDPLPAEYTTLLGVAGAHHLRLEAMDAADIETLVCQRLGVTDLPPPVAQLIHQKAEGHPFFSEELACALRDSGLITIRDGRCHLASSAGLDGLRSPDTIQAVITSRIDLLSPEQQLALKVASVIGRQFPFRALQDVHPIAGDRPQLQTYLDVLERLEVVLPESPGPEKAYTFKHAITREVTYSLLASAQRTQLHQAVAEWYERNHANDLAPFYPLLAHHWRQTDNVVKRWHYLELAGEQASHRYANREASTFFSEALALAEREPERFHQASTAGDGQMLLPVRGAVRGGAATLRRARWERMLGLAYGRMGQLNETRRHYANALTLLGQPLPESTAGKVAGLLKELFRQLAHRLMAARLVDAAPLAGQPAVEELALIDAAQQIFYFTQEQALFLWDILRRLNLAESVGNTAVKGYVYGSLVLIAGFIPLHSLARLYLRLAWEAMEAAGKDDVRAFVLLIQGVYYEGLGQWSTAEEALQRGVEVAARMGDGRRLSTLRASLAMGFHLQSHFVRSASAWEEIYQQAQEEGNQQGIAWGLYGRGYNLLLLGRQAEAIHLLEASLATPDESDDAILGSNRLGGLALAYLRYGDPDQALALARKQQEAVPNPPLAFSTLSGSAGAAETFLVLWERAQAAGDEKTVQEMKAAARRAGQVLRAHGKRFPATEAGAWFYQGWYNWLAGRRQEALSTWNKSLACAEHVGQPYEAGRAHYELGRRLGNDHPARITHLAQAVQIFEQLQAVYELELARAALATAKSSARD
ncbi:MAG: AAA family ATPase, partial [Chloroflexi bacterium]|nr:AAA family ATPase [Chloroflexota bacterium]